MAPERVAEARATVAGVLRLQLLANGIGVAIVVLYVRLLYPVPHGSARAELNLIVFGVYLAANLLLALPLNVLLLRRAVAWVAAGGPPTERQRQLTFRLPLYETIAALVMWLGAAVLFGVLNADVRRLSIGIALAGLVTCTFLYLLVEGHFRPVFALALRDSELPANRRDIFPRLMLAWTLGSAVPLAALGLTPALDPGPLDRSRLPWLALAGIVGGGVVMAGAAVSVSRPLNRVRRALRRVEQGHLEAKLPVDDLGELGRLAEGVNHLVSGLREREQLRDLFERQVGQADLVALAAGAEGPVTSEGEVRRVSVLFVDLQGYTRYSERHAPSDVVAMLNRFFQIVVAVVNREGGWVNKFEGDAALAVFGAPADQPDHAARALRAAMALPDELASAQDVLPSGIGVATGDVLAGFVGTAERFEYTVIGDVVNLAARLCDEAKHHPSPVLASAATVLEAGMPEPWQPAGALRIRGRAGRAAVYTIPTDRRGGRRGGRVTQSSRR